jgi:hypothetical protein
MYSAYKELDGKEQQWCKGDVVPKVLLFYLANRHRYLV